MDENRDPIMKFDLQMRLARAAQVRAIVSMLAFVVLLLVGGPIAKLTHPAAGVFLIGGGYGLVCWLMTKYYCRRRVVCPHCGSSLWNCGTGNFKPRRMRLRPGAIACPGCGAPLV